MKSLNMGQEQMTFWQLIFSQSKANGAQYEGERLPICIWSWPTDTYLQRMRSSRQSTHFLSAGSERMEMAAR